MRTTITIDKLTPKIKYKILHFLFNAPLAINIRYYNKNPAWFKKAQNRVTIDNKITRAF